MFYDVRPVCLKFILILVRFFRIQRIHLRMRSRFFESFRLIKISFERPESLKPRLPESRVGRRGSRSNMIYRGNQCFSHVTPMFSLDLSPSAQHRRVGSNNCYIRRSSSAKLTFAVQFLSVQNHRILLRPGACGPWTIVRLC